MGKVNTNKITDTLDQSWVGCKWIMWNGFQNKNVNTTCLKTLIYLHSLKIFHYNKMVQKLDHSFKINIHIAQFY